MNQNECKDLIQALQQGVVTVTFQKIDSDEIRVMPCTLNSTILESNGVLTTVESVSPASSNIPVWSIDKDAWRSFRVDTVTGWVIQ